MYTFNWALTAFRSESYIGSATALPDTKFKVHGLPSNFSFFAAELVNSSVDSSSVDSAAVDSFFQYGRFQYFFV